MPDYLTCTNCGLLEDGQGTPDVSCECPRCEFCDEHRCVCDQSGVLDDAHS